MRISLNRYGLVGPIAFVAACAASGGGTVFDNDAGTQGVGAGAGVTTGSNGVSVGISAGSGPVDTGCNTGAAEDHDKDGWTVADGDCNDCDPNVNPGAVEVIATADVDGGIPMPVDEDCDGKIDNVPQPCDDNLKIDASDPMDAAKAVDLCQIPVDAKHWGVISAKWVLPDGAAAPLTTAYAVGHGLLGTFGPNVNVQAGKRMLGLSSGTARAPSDAGYTSPSKYDKKFTCNPPPGFPKESPACPNVKTGQPHDAAALELSIRVPSNAHGFSFDFNFFTYEWPDFICSEFNDFFVALLSTTDPSSFANISFDSQGNPVSVNNAFVEVCSCLGGPPCVAGTSGGTKKQFDCKLGNKGLKGTGFDDLYNSASTAWLVTKSPVTPGQQVTLRWAVYDSGDGKLDTTTLIDHWQWIAESGTTVGTGQVPTPK
jgi:hypothetical protein